jgi:ribonucleoside-diphosphate reductase beta chain|tara:strand:+ start:1769 stop:2749 length:981 start_codon:yes stop_codon:yes gene_type:complete
MSEITEPLLIENKNKYVLFPIEYHDIWSMYKKHVSTYWTVEEIDLAKDHDDWIKLSDNERYFIKNVLAFFAASDGIVNENLVLNFMSEIKVPEALAFYSFQNAIETVHSETYSLLIDTYIKDEVEKSRLLNAIETIPCIQKKANWAIKWIENGNDNFATRLIAFACVEGIFFSGAFCSIYWLKEKGLMHGLTFSNELISRDESLHTEFAILLYSHIKNKLSEEVVHNIIKDAVIIEKEFIIDSLPCKLLGMNSDLMSQYIEFVADRISLQLGYIKIYNVSNPFDFMDRIGLEDKQNFFEVRVSNYSKAELHNTKNSKLEFNMNDDF